MGVFQGIPQQNNQPIYPDPNNTNQVTVNLQLIAIIQQLWRRITLVDTTTSSEIQQLTAKINDLNSRVTTLEKP